MFKVLCILPLLFVSGYSDPSFLKSNDETGESKGTANWGDISSFFKLDGKNGVSVTLKPKKNKKKRTLDNKKPPAGGKNIWLTAKPAAAAPAANTAFNGKWELVSQNSGVSAMHSVLIPKINKVLMYDATVWKISKIPLPPNKLPCRVVHDTNQTDCWAHAVLFDIQTSELKPLKINTDTWCSSGGLAIDGHFVGTGGYKNGANTARYLYTCDDCDWNEYPTALAEPRWYATQVTLSDGRFIVVGGRDAFSYEFIPEQGKSNVKAIPLELLRQTYDTLKTPEYRLENNLYPFVHLSTDGNLFIFANNRSILLDPYKNDIVKVFPVLEGGSRNYPASGMSVILPIKLDAAYNQENHRMVDAEVMICGGGQYDAYYYGETKKPYLPPALQDCGRIVITHTDPVWKKEMMPSPRVMGDAGLLPNGDVLMMNGAKQGSSGWNCAESPNFVPVLYKPNAPVGQRFRELQAGTIPRMYHSSIAVLPDGKVLVSGSNTHDGYIYDAKYPTELRVEKFLPPYLDPSLSWLKPEIVFESSDKTTSYRKRFSVKFMTKEANFTKQDIQVTMYAPAFTTHGISMNQRLLILGLAQVNKNVAPGVHNIVAVAPPAGSVAPPGYYLLSVVLKGVPSYSMWFQITNESLG